MSRAVSTVVDATLFLLLVSAAAMAVAIPPDSLSTQTPDASGARTVVATTTASVDYSLAPGAQEAAPDLTVFPREQGPEFRRSAHGTLAGLVARATVRNVTVDGIGVTHTADGFEQAVANATADATTARTHVVGRWRPFSGASIVGRQTAGGPPPADARVGSETLSVDSGFSNARPAARRAANRSGYTGVAHVVANATVRGLLPPGEMRLALAGDYPVDRLAAHRYRRFGRLLGTDISGPLRREEVAVANRRLRRALAARFERTMRARFDSPQAAARSVRVGEVSIVVRRWSR